MLFYLIAYLFMNLGAFAVVAFLRNQTGSEDLSDFRGLVRRSPVLVVTLARLPAQPARHAAAGRVRGQVPDLQRAVSTPARLRRRRRSRASATLMYALLVIGGLNTVISVVYYIKVLKVMILEKPLEEVEGRRAGAAAGAGRRRRVRGAAGGVVIGLGVAWNPLAVASARA